MKHLNIVVIREDKYSALLNQFPSTAWRHVKVRDLSLGCQDRSFTDNPILNIITSYHTKQGANRSMTYEEGITLPLESSGGIYDLRGVGVEMRWIEAQAWFLVKVTPKDSNPWYYHVGVDVINAFAPNSMTFKIKCLEGVV